MGLVLKRRLNQSVVITAANGQRIEVQPVEIGEGWVRLEFTAEKSVVIDRVEVAQQKAKAQPDPRIQAERLAVADGRGLPPEVDHAG